MHLYYTFIVFRPIRQLADRFNVLQMGMVASERVFKVIDTYDSISNLGKISLIIVEYIEFKNVWFAYNGEDWVLKDISFKISAGETIA